MDTCRQEGLCQLVRTTSWAILILLGSYKLRVFEQRKALKPFQIKQEVKIIIGLVHVYLELFVEYVCM